MAFLPHKTLRELFWQLLISLAFTAVTFFYSEYGGINDWKYAIVFCALTATGTSINLSIGTFSRQRLPGNIRVHFLRLLGSNTVLWISYILFEEVFFRYSTIRHSVIYQNILPFLIIALWLFSLKFIYRLDHVFFAIFLIEMLLTAAFIVCFSIDAMGEWYYLASSLMVVLFVFPAVVRVK